MNQKHKNKLLVKKHVKLGKLQDVKRYWACERKIRHLDKSSADLILHKLGRGSTLHSYLCPHCQSWHLGRKQPSATLPVKSDIFHDCAWMAFAEASAEGRHLDSEYVKQLAYKYYERELSMVKEAREKS